jgi:very-short-patch-repair endonuclease
VSVERPPHPDAARPPSPARGEGAAARGERPRPKSALVSLGARARRIKKTSPIAEPSPLAGEGGAAAPGEGALPRKVTPKRSKRIGQPNPNRSTRMRNLARSLRKDMTDAERKLWFLLRDRRLTGFKFRRQVPVGRYVADFLSFEMRLIVEADGSQHDASLRDAERDAWLRQQGYRILRFWNSEILNNPDGILARIMDAKNVGEATR